jgi:hypothetical protein
MSWSLLARRISPGEDSLKVGCMLSGRRNNTSIKSYSKTGIQVAGGQLKSSRNFGK